jgi:hypothetical protein
VREGAVTRTTECPILRHMRQVAIVNMRKRDRTAIQQIDLEGTKKDEATEMRRAQVCLEAFYVGAKVKDHPGGALSALKVASVRFIGLPNAMPKTSARRARILARFSPKPARGDRRIWCAHFYRTVVRFARSKRTGVRWHCPSTTDHGSEQAQPGPVVRPRAPQINPQNPTPNNYQNHRR